MLIREATAADAEHLVRFINMAADDLPLHFWRKSVGPDGEDATYVAWYWWDTNERTRQFERKFHKAYQVSPRAYHVRMRVAAASDLLKDTALRPSEIADRTGFYDASDFSRQFRRAMKERAIYSQPISEGGQNWTSKPNQTQCRKVDGGWEVSGRAAWGSGVMHADWVLMSGKAEDGPRSFLMPIDAVEVLDTWHFAGMAGTGSNDYVARSVFVPDAHAITAGEFHGGATEGSRLHDNPLFSIPFLVSAYCTILPVITGSLKGMMGAYEAMIDKRVRNFSGVVLKDQQTAHTTWQPKFALHLSAAKL